MLEQGDKEMLICIFFSLLEVHFDSYFANKMPLSQHPLYDKGNDLHCILTNETFFDIPCIYTRTHTENTTDSVDNVFADIFPDMHCMYDERQRVYQYNLTKQNKKNAHVSGMLTS